MDLLTWNTQWCCGIDGVVSPKRVVEAARRIGDFDVLCLQEIAVNYPQLAGGAGHDQPAILGELLPGFQLFFGAAVDEFSPTGERRRFGNLIATRLPVAQVQHHALPYPADPGVRSMPRMCTVVTVVDPKLGPVRIMTTHLEFYSKPQRMAQARALRELHVQYCAQAAGPPKPSGDGSPFQTKRHTTEAILCGDFNFEAYEPEYAAVSEPLARSRLWDSWRLLHGDQPHQPTFRLYDRHKGTGPVACDFVFVSDGLKDKVRSLAMLRCRRRITSRCGFGWVSGPQRAGKTRESAYRHSTWLFAGVRCLSGALTFAELLPRVEKVAFQPRPLID